MQMVNVVAVKVSRYKSMHRDLSKNYFELFALPQSYAVDEANLSQQFRIRQASVHPDKFVNASDADKRLSMQQATLTNEAHETLKSPLRRALYLLRLQSYDPDANKVQLDPAFLMEQMMLRESVSEAPHQDDPYDTLDEIGDQVIAQKKAMIRSIQNAFGHSEPEYDTIHVMTQKLQFFDKLIAEISHIEAKLDDA
jgi:molecular chaperone HscB